MHAARAALHPQSSTPSLPDRVAKHMVWGHVCMQPPQEVTAQKVPCMVSACMQPTQAVHPRRCVVSRIRDVCARV